LPRRGVTDYAARALTGGLAREVSTESTEEAGLLQFVQLQHRLV